MTNSNEPQAVGAGTLFDYLAAARRAAQEAPTDGPGQPEAYAMPAAPVVGAAPPTYTSPAPPPSMPQAAVAEPPAPVVTESLRNLDLTVEPPRPDTRSEFDALAAARVALKPTVDESTEAPPPPVTIAPIAVAPIVVAQPAAEAPVEAPTAEHTPRPRPHPARARRRRPSQRNPSARRPQSGSRRRQARRLGKARP